MVGEIHVSFEPEIPALLAPEALTELFQMDGQSRRRAIDVIQRVATNAVPPGARRVGDSPHLYASEPCALAEIGYSAAYHAMGYSIYPPTGAPPDSPSYDAHLPLAPSVLGPLSPAAAGGAALLHSPAFK